MSASKYENLLNENLRKALVKVSGLDPKELPVVYPYLEFPKEKSFGDVSVTSALKLSGTLKQPPREIAAKIVSYLNEEIPNCELKDVIAKIDIAGPGFINFTFKPVYFYFILKDIMETGGKGIAKTDKPRKALVEFVSANPTGSLSVAHGRQAAVGDALCNVLEFLGHEVKREYYLNDEGNQINILGNSIYLRLRELQGEKIEFPEDHYQGEYIRGLAEELAPGAASSKPPEFYREYGVKRILDIIKKELDDFGVKFDSWYSQASLRESGKIDRSIELLKEKGYIYESEGAVWFASTKFLDDKDRVIVKSDGSYTYLAPDIAYHQDKYKRGFEWLINFWGPDHHGYINRLKSSVAAFGKDANSLNIVIVQLATLFKEGKVVSMSTRKGEYITLREVMDEVGKDAARFFFVMRKTDSHLDFDLELAKKQNSENPVFYVQYAHARICNILVNAKLSSDTLKNADLSLLDKKEELDLLKALAKFEWALKVAEIQLDPYPLTSYLQELAESFHRFYDVHRVLSDDASLTNARLALIFGCKTIIALGLSLLGVKAPEKM